MIVDRIEHADRYLSLHPRFAAGFDYLRRFDLATADGEYPIDGERLYARPHRYITAPDADRRWESHRRYVDIQYIVAGQEVILHAPIERLPAPTTYDAGNDVIFYGEGDAASRVVLEAGSFAIFYASDGHKPGVAVRGAELVRKIVVKVELTI